MINAQQMRAMQKSPAGAVGAARNPVVGVRRPVRRLKNRKAGRGGHRLGGSSR